MYYIVIWHLHMLWNDHHKSSNHLLPHSYSNIIDHIPYAVYYILMAYLFYNWRFVSLNPLSISLPATLLPSGIHLFVLCNYDSLFIYFLLF